MTDLSKTDDTVHFAPDVLPPSIRDVQASPQMDMHQPMSDPCPSCGGYRMQVGDWQCWGMCFVCLVEQEREHLPY